MTIQINVLDSQWSADDEVFPGGVHVIADPSAGLLACIAGAAAVGVLEIIDPGQHQETLGGAVQSQEDGESAYEKAQADGSWQEGNLIQYELDAANPDAPTGEIA